MRIMLVISLVTRFTSKTRSILIYTDNISYYGTNAHASKIYQCNIKMVKKEKFSILGHLHNRIETINNSKIFAGLMIIILNIASKFVDLKLSKNVELYLKHSFSKQIVVFAIAWMGTRDVYIALFITILFVIGNDYLFNEESQLCVLPESFTNEHEEMNKVSEADIKKAKDVLERAEKQKEPK